MKKQHYFRQEDISRSPAPSCRMAAHCSLPGSAVAGRPHAGTSFQKFFGKKPVVNDAVLCPDRWQRWRRTAARRSCSSVSGRACPPARAGVALAGGAKSRPRVHTVSFQYRSAVSFSVEMIFLALRNTIYYTRSVW